jgi:hypothetical protein
MAANDSVPLTDAELQAIKARCDAATSGPWEAVVEGRDQSSGSSFIETPLGSTRGYDIEMSGATEADYDFIAHARQDIPRLLQEIDRLRRELASRASAANHVGIHEVGTTPG